MNQTLMKPFLMLAIILAATTLSFCSDINERASICNEINEIGPWTPIAEDNDGSTTIRKFKCDDYERIDKIIGRDLSESVYYKGNNKIAQDSFTMGENRQRTYFKDNVPFCTDNYDKGEAAFFGDGKYSIPAGFQRSCYLII
jgi:hypothetical protein